MAPRVHLDSIELLFEANQGSNEKNDCDRCSVYSGHGLRTSLGKQRDDPGSDGSHNPEWLRHCYGTVLGLSAGLFLTLGCLASSFVTSMGSMQAMGLKFLSSGLMLAILVGIFKPKVGVEIGTHLKLVALSLVFAAKFIAFTVGSNSLPIAEFSLLANTVPIYTTAFGCIFLRQRSLKKAVACAVATAGVVTVCLPSFAGADAVPAEQQARQVTGYASTLFSAVANAIALIWLRNLGSISAMWVSLYASLATALVATAGATSIDELVVPSWSDLCFVTLAGFCTLMQLYLPALACVLTDPSRIAISMTSAVFFSFILQGTVEHNVPSAPTYVGGALVVFAMVIVSVKWRPQKTEPDEEKAANVISEQLHYSWGRYGAVALIGSPESGRLCRDCRLAV